MAIISLGWGDNQKHLEIIMQVILIQKSIITHLSLYQDILRPLLAN